MKMRKLLGLFLLAALTACHAQSTEENPAGEDSDMLAIGQKAPDFTLQDDRGKNWTLSKLEGKKRVVLVFYPGDSTPVCRSQFCAIRDDFVEFQREDVQVFGINPQSAESHNKFREKNNFPFPLLVDKEKKVVRAYGADGLLMTKRTVYGIDKKGYVVFAERGRPDNAEILAAFPEE